MKKIFTSALSLLLVATGLVSASAAVPENGVYEIKHSDRGYLTQNVEANSIHPGDATLGGFTTSDKCVVGRNENGHNSYWYLYTSETSGSSYIFSVSNGMFLAYENGTASGAENASLLNLSETPAPFDVIDARVSDYYEIHAKGVTATAFSNSIGWGKNVTYRFASVVADYDGIAHAFVAATVENADEVIENGIAAIKAEELKALIAEKKAQIEVYFAASQDPDFYMDILTQFDWCETAEEVEETYFYLLESAYMFMESSMEMGSVWKNNRTGQYVTAEAAEADGAVSFKLNSDLTLNAYWIAEFIDGGNGGIAPMNEGDEEGNEPMVVEGRRFVLRNVLTNAYVGNQSENNAVVPAVATKEEAAALKLVAGANGFEILITNDEIENNFLNTYSTDLVTNQTADNIGAYWSMLALPAFSAEQPVEIKFIGETVEGEYGMIEWRNITGVAIKVPHGATPTALGSVSIMHYNMMTGEQPVDAQYSISDLIEGVTPVAEDLEIDAGYFDPNLGEYIENIITVNCDVYTVNFETPITDYNYYIVRMSNAAFSLTVDGTTLYSPEVSSDADVVAPPVPFDVIVNPEAGIVAELAQINIICEKTIYQSYWNYEPMTLVANGETTLFELFAGNMNSYQYLDFDNVPAIYFQIPVADAITAYYNKLNEDAVEGEEITVPTFDPKAVGSYVLTIPKGFFTDDSDNESNPATVTWTIEEQDGINVITNVTVNGNVIYDLQGRRVANPEKGIYIINGKKTLVK